MSECHRFSDISPSEDVQMECGEVFASMLFQDELY